jgi:putative SOS response-associated peptidase YedK
MPVILSPDDYGLWLDPEVSDANKLHSLLRPYPPDEMDAYPISTVVNNPRNERSECVERATA